MIDLAGPIVEWLNANPELAGLATFLISAAESIAIIGTIVPGSIMMTAIGALVGTGIIPLWSTLIWAILGAIVGDGVSYWLGYHFKDRIYEIWPFRKYPKILQSGEVFFRKHGGMSVFIGRFVGPVRALVPVVAGMFGMRPLVFTIANVTSAIGWAPAYMLPGFLLGAASLELPSELAGHVVLTLLIWIVIAFLCIWILKNCLKMIHTKVEQFLSWIWDLLEKSRYFNLLVTTLKHYDRKKTHGQLKMAFYLILILVVFFYLALDILFQGSANIFINKVVFYFFRGLRSPSYDDAFIYITFLGDKYVLLPLIITVFGWLAWKKHWRLAWHILALGILLVSSVIFFREAVHSVRPWGILNNHDRFSFPSGHATLSFTLYFGIALLLLRVFKTQRYRFLFFISSIIVTAIAISRLYFGIHWFTDIIGSWLLGSAILMMITMSYHRKADNTDIQPRGIILTLLLTLAISYSLKVFISFDTTKYDYTKLDWPTYTISTDSWWNQQGNHLPLYRVNRLGIRTKILNLQWVGDLGDITKILLNNGWQIPEKSDWISMLYRLSSVESTAHLPLVLPLYLDKPPVIVLTKLLNKDRLLILRFWNSNIHLQNSSYPLWVGMVEIAPSTYSWLSIKQRYPEAGFRPDWVFTTLPTQYEIKVLPIKVKTNHHHSKNIPMILLKPNAGATNHSPKKI